VHVREDRGNGASLARRLGSPGGRIKMFDKKLVHAIIGRKDPDRGSAEWSVNPGLTIDVLTLGHGYILPDLDCCLAPLRLKTPKGGALIIENCT
jgi:hypothetical protein